MIERRRTQGSGAQRQPRDRVVGVAEVDSEAAAPQTETRRGDENGWRLSVSPEFDSAPSWRPRDLSLAAEAERQRSVVDLCLGLGAKVKLELELSFEEKGIGAGMTRGGKRGRDAGRAQSGTRKAGG